MRGNSEIEKEFFTALKEGDLDSVKALAPSIEPGKLFYEEFDGRPSRFPQNAVNIATKYGHLDIVKELIGRGFEVNRVRNGDDIPTPFPIAQAAKYGHIDIFNFFIEMENSLTSPSYIGHEEDTPIYDDIGYEIDDIGYEALLYAAMGQSKNRYKIVSRLLEKGAALHYDGDDYIAFTVEFHASDHDTPLIIAARNDDARMCEMFLSKASSGGYATEMLSVTDEKGCDCLALSILEGSSNVYNLLFSKYRDINQNLTMGDRPIEEIFYEAPNAVKNPIALVAEISTPLGIASINGDVDLVVSLLSRGANLDLYDKIISLANKLNHIDVVKTLEHAKTVRERLGAAAFPHAVDALFSGGAGAAAGGGSGAAAGSSFMLDESIYRVPYTEGIEEILNIGDVGYLNGYLKHKAFDRNEFFPLEGERNAIFIAVENNNTPLFNRLLILANEKCPELLPNLLNDKCFCEDGEGEEGEEMNTLDVAAKNGNVEMVIDLFLIGAVPSASTLYLAVENGHLDVVRELILNGCNANACFDEWGDAAEDALMCAARNGNIKIVELLLNNGANPNYLYEESSALHEAFDKGNLDMAALLLARGATENLLSERVDERSIALYSAFKPFIDEIDKGSVSVYPDKGDLIYVPVKGRDGVPKRLSRHVDPLGLVEKAKPLEGEDWEATTFGKKQRKEKDVAATASGLADEADQRLEVVLPPARFEIKFKPVISPPATPFQYVPPATTESAASPSPVAQPDAVERLMSTLSIKSSR